MTTQTAIAFLQSKGVVYKDNPTFKRFELTGATAVFGKEAGITATLLREDGSPYIGDGTVFVCTFFPDLNGDVPQQPDGSGAASFMFNANSAYTPPAPGPFTLSIANEAEKITDPPKHIRFDKLISPSIQGMGDLNGEHTHWFLQFRELGTTPPPIDPPVDPGLPVVTNDEMLRTLANDAAGISYNPIAALVKYARDNHLGNALASESRFKDAIGRVWAYQPFALGIVKCVEGDWGNCFTVLW